MVGGFTAMANDYRHNEMLQLTVVAQYVDIVWHSLPSGHYQLSPSSASSYFYGALKYLFCVYGPKVLPFTVDGYLVYSLLRWFVKYFGSEEKT